jgi:Mg2+ and Co2+ transporter CorA
MQATIFDGTSSKPCTVQEAQAAANQPGISWIDIRLESGDAAASADMLKAVGVDPAAATQVLTQGLGTDFEVSPTDIHGVCWLDDNDGSPTTQAYFTWNSMRLVTVRSSGDAAVAQVRERITDRVALLTGDPSTLPGVVLQLMLATVQRGLTQTIIDIGALDMEIIATPAPQAGQLQKLNAFRQSMQGIALRFPMYSVNVQTALIDPAPVQGLDDAGKAQLQQFLSSVQGTSGLLSSAADALKSAAQDIQAQVSAWQGNRINVLTIVTMIFLPITFLTGYFGMNFNWLEDQLNSFASWLVLGLLLPIALVLGATALLARKGYAVPRLRRHAAPRPDGGSPPGGAR